MDPNKDVILSEMYRSFEALVETRRYRQACMIFLKSLRFSLLYFLKTIFNRRKKYYDFFKEILYRIKYRFPIIRLSASQEIASSMIVSLTSYPVRFPTLHLVLKSILKQTLRPMKIVLYLDDWVKIEDVPRRIRRLQKFGLEIRLVGKNIKPHTKYFYAMHDFPDTIIVTVDDDQIYPNDMLESLYALHKRYSQCVIARRVMRILRDENGQALSNNMWEAECSTVLYPSMELLAQGVGGVLYPPNIFDETFSFFNENLIREVCLNADDIWLKFMEMKKQIPVLWCPNDLKFHAIHYENRLMNTNVLADDNDKQIKQCEKVFNMKL